MIVRRNGTKGDFARTTYSEELKDSSEIPKLEQSRREELEELSKILKLEKNDMKRGKAEGKSNSFAYCGNASQNRRLISYLNNTSYEESICGEYDGPILELEYHQGR